MAATLASLPPVVDLCLWTLLTGNRYLTRAVFQTLPCAALFEYMAKTDNATAARDYVLAVRHRAARAKEALRTGREMALPHARKRRRLSGGTEEARREADAPRDDDATDEEDANAAAPHPTAASPAVSPGDAVTSPTRSPVNADAAPPVSAEVQAACDAEDALCLDREKSALLSVVFHNALTSAKTMLSLGVPPTYVQPENGWSLLHLCAYLNRGEMAKLLLEYRAYPRAVTEKGETPFDIAAKYNKTNVLAVFAESKRVVLQRQTAK
jgi:hypothetical protein